MDILTGILIGVLLTVIYYLYNLRRPLSRQDVIRRLVRQAARWSTAAKQDESPLISVLHANYGVGYLMALSEFASPDEIEFAAGINYFEFDAAIKQAQDDANRKAVALMPQFAGVNHSNPLAKIAGEA